MTVPRRIGRYEVLRPLARGGMAVLYLGRSTGLGVEKLVVLKKVRPEYAEDPAYVQMFVDEARLQAGLHHANLVQVYDLDDDEDRMPFYAMEYIHGEDLRKVVRAAVDRDGRVPLEHALTIAIGVCNGLHYAHEKRADDGTPLGIVHRDVSPHNVAVTWDGGVKVMDFGVAKARRRLTETRLGTIKGKPQYMAPEQCRGEEVDRRADVFAIGILLWELVAGQTLYPGRSELEIMKAVTESDAPPLGQFWDACPPELEAIVSRALRRRRSERYQTAEALQLDLEAFARERRLALSPVGLARYLRELFGDRVAAWSQAVSAGPEALASLAMSRLDEPEPEGEDTLVAEGTPAASASAPARRTRAVAGRSGGRRVGRALAAVGLAGGVAALAFLLARAPSAEPSPAAPPQTPRARPAPRPLAERPATELPAPAPPPPAAAAPAATEPPVAPPVAAPKPPRSTAKPGRRRAVTRNKPSPAPAKTTPPSVDLDAPLPPR